MKNKPGRSSDKHMVILIDEDGKKVGEVTLGEAKSRATESGKDLVMVSAKNNVYKIADAGKLKYEEQQRRKRQSAQRRTHKVKEVQLRPLTDKHDLDVKARRIRKFLSDGLKTKVVMRFKGRQMANTKSAEEKFNELINEFVKEGMATISGKPKFEGRNLVTFLVPNKE